MPDRPRIYLDNAATSFPKPEGVYRAMDSYHRRLGTAVGRGAYRDAMEVQGVVDHCRAQAARLLGAEAPSRIIFTFNGTDSLNLAIQGVLRPGDHVVTSVLEHNSVLRPLRFLEERRGIRVTRVAVGSSGCVDPVDIRQALRPETRLVALIHASNVTGAIQPVEEVAQIAREAGVLCLVDAAQSVGHLPLNVAEAGIDLLACPGHKGLLGPLGTGLLYIRPGLEGEVLSLRQGGTGSSSEDDRQPERLPEKYEAGNHNAPGLIGLAAGLDYLLERGLAAVRAHEQECTRLLREGLKEIPGLESHGPSRVEQQVGVLSVSHPDWEPQELAAILDERFGIQTRAGLHCAPGAHATLGTLSRGGTVRLSSGPFTTSAEISQALQALSAIAASMA